MNSTEGGTIVAESARCQVMLTSYGFYARCTRCLWVSEYTAAKHVARRWASEHDQDDRTSGDGSLAEKLAADMNATDGIPGFDC